MSQRRLLIHVSDRDKWPYVLQQIDGLRTAEEDSGVNVVIVADIFAGGVCVACNRVLREQMKAFVQAGHRILACEDSLKGLNLRSRALPEFVEPVPNGLQEIIRKQQEGYCYIKL